jgi:cytoskeletal protein CcmA (bactofilin family)
MANTVIGSGIVIDGEIGTDEELVVRGTVKGKIHGKEAVLVEANAVVEADIDARSVEVAGQVNGNVTASDRVELKADSHVTGDIRSSRILIADGASFRGSINMDVGSKR